MTSAPANKAVADAGTKATKSPSGARSSTSWDLTEDAKFQKEQPQYIEAIRQLISQRYSCPAVAALWVRGESPNGLKLEALCGQRGTTNANTLLHYAVYPDRLLVNPCPEFSAFTTRSACN